MYTIRHKTYKAHRSLCVGILTIPHMKKTKHGSSHIMKPYVDWFEERGVRVIPIPYDTTEHEMYFNMINGLFIPGGETSYIINETSFIDTVMRFLELSLEYSDYFPIWGTCFGFQLLIMIVGGFTKLKKYPTHGQYPIHITRDGWNSRLFGSMPTQYLKYLEEHKSTAENHEYGISPNNFMENDNLRKFYNVLATSKDESGREYVAAIESKFYPIYGVQWHPERQTNATHFVDFFISEMRKSKHKCKTTRYLTGFLKPHKCTQYSEHRDLLCYFF